MSKKRTELSAELHKICDNVYFKNPRSEKMVYPCIKYDLSGYNLRFANDKIYHDEKRYTVTYITTNPDDEAIDELLRLLPKTRFERSYKSGNLYHNVYEIKY